VLVNGTSGLTTILAKRVSLTASKMPGSEIIFADDLDVASDGTVYFSTLTDVPPIPASTNEYDALKPCVLNILQVTTLDMRSAAHSTALLASCARHQAAYHSVPVHSLCHV